MRAMPPLAVEGGPKAVRSDPGNLFTWPVITEEHERAVLDVLRRGAMSGLDVTERFEQEFAAWQGLPYALACNTGTAALHSAFFACGVGVGDEVICPSATYWASCLPVFSLGATVVFADIEPHSLCVDPADIERRITDRTKAIVVVHYCGHPADMDPILEIGRRRGIRVIEDVSHAQGGLYKGRKLGTFGDVAAMSLMSGKSLAIGEGGILVTGDRDLYERALAFGHYGRFNRAHVTSPALLALAGLPLGGHKYRMHQLSAAVGRVQVAHYDEQAAEIRRAMNHFWDLLEGVPGLRAHRPPKDAGSTMAGWYAAHGHYVPEEVGGLSVTAFARAVRAEGCPCAPGANRPLHLHPLFRTADVYGDGRPTRIARTARDVREGPGALPVSEAMGARVYTIPWFKRFRPEQIAEYAGAFRKVAGNADRLLASDAGNPPDLGGWWLSPT